MASVWQQAGGRAGSEFPWQEMVLDFASLALFSWGRYEDRSEQALREPPSLFERGDAKPKTDRKVSEVVCDTSLKPHLDLVQARQIVNREMFSLSLSLSLALYLSLSLSPSLSTNKRSFATLLENHTMASNQLD